MKQKLLILIFFAVFNSCSILSIMGFSETIGGIKIQSVQDIENKDGVIFREIRGTIDAPLETDEDWFIAFQSIYSQKKVVGMSTTIKIFVDQENWEIGTPYAVGKFSEEKKTTIKVDGRLIKIKKP